ncbi:hypothetical protein QMK19_29060 [Streptomyces sp. H10-C2]|uniref:hypothetical protein n=1 Tax=Streptomyces TaxID=1883 RepID=UPI0018DFFB15|nr:MULTISPECIES: hypothetical protein [Streptomyces]MDJ0344261.1 hypothetical protein [Streptomyces sp. PH10-H1]MDJ0373599.1 hypothetical protein [Streptomyces sp. H10-C2]
MTDATAQTPAPAVRAARAILTRAALPLATLNATGHTLSAGAYLDPRSATGEIVVSYEHAHDDATSSEDYHDTMRRSWAIKDAANAYRRAFKAAGWQVTTLNDFRMGSNLPRLIITPPPLTCEVFVSPQAGHCTAPATRVLHPAVDPATRLLVCGAHPQQTNQFFHAWTVTEPRAYEADHGPLTQDAAIHGGRQAPQAAAPAVRTRAARCEDCGEEIEVDSDGFRTLCACDAAE